MSVPNGELESVASRIAQETMEVWETHVQSGQQALVESHQESFSVIARAGVHVGDRSVTDVLTERLGDEDRWVREAAAEALGQIGASASAVVETLIKALGRTDGRSANRIAKVLHSLPWHMFSGIRGDEEAQRGLPKAQGGVSQVDGVVQAEDKEHLLAHWQALARLPE